MLRFARRNAAPTAIRIGLLVTLLLTICAEPAAGYRMINSMHQYVNGKLVTVNGRPTWPNNATVHVYIPNDPRR